MSVLNRLVVDRFLKRLDHIDYGSLKLLLPDGRTYEFEGKNPGPRSNIVLNDWSVFPNLAANGDSGFACDYRDELWQTDDLAGLIKLGLMNESLFKPYIFGSPASQIMGRIKNMLRINTAKGSRKNIHAHYDLGNDFYKLWLDETMTYSAALYSNPLQSLEQAQYNKYDRILNRLEKPSGSLLEIGCGWGGFAERAMERGDFDLKGVTISDEQYLYAKKRMGNKAEISLEDYRLQQGKFNNIVSIEMFEAVGEFYWQTYLAKIRNLLDKGGKAIIQTITIDDLRFERYRRGTDVIRNYIFPGGMLPSPSRFRAEAASAGLRVNDEFHFGDDYARTLEQWLNTFDRKTGSVIDLGFDHKFIRLWRFYLASCIAGFSTGRTSVMQVELQHA